MRGKTQRAKGEGQREGYAQPSTIRSQPSTGQADLMRLAARLFWWKPAQEALALPRRFLAQVMVLGTWEDVEIARKHWTDDDFRQVLNEPPAGVFDPRSWSYWHRVLGLGPAPPLPTRRLP